jgi:hypothetical protein
VSLISDYINDEDRTNMTCLIVRINFLTRVLMCSCFDCGLLFVARCY